MRKVLKFGGTSVKDAKMLSITADICAAQNCELAVVLSAASGVTNKLVDALKHENLNEENVSTFIKSLSVQHHTMIDDGISSESVKKEARQAIDAKIEKLHKYLSGLALIGEATAKNKDFVVSTGERLTTAILHGMLKERKKQSVLLESDKIGMTTDGIYGNASPDLAAIEDNFKTTALPHINGGAIAIITGFFGSAGDSQNPATFGRGGSDYSAAIVGYGINADLIEIWTDVDGFMSADPRMVKNARFISEMSYSESAELAFFGAKVLHPRTVEPAKLKGIPILIKNTYNKDHEGTRISALSPRDRQFLRCVSSKPNLAIIKIFSHEMAFQPTFATKVLSLLSSHNISTYTISTSLATFSVVVDNSAVPEILNILSKAKEIAIEKSVVRRDMALVCVVGDTMDGYGVAAKIFGVVADNRINLEMISEGASDVALNFVVANDDETATIQAIHKAFIG